MTIDNKEWLMNRVLQLYLTGFTQEEISIDLEISEGTTNAIIKELISSDDVTQLQHEVAVVSKKTGQSVKQLASNLAFANAIVKLAFDNNKIHGVLMAINKIVVPEGHVTPEVLAKIVLDIFNEVLKNKIPLDELVGETRNKFEQLHELERKVRNQQSLLNDLENRITQVTAEYGLTTDKISKCIKLIDCFENAGLDIQKSEEVENVLWAIHEQDGDALKIIEELKKIRLLKLKISELETQCQEVKENLQFMHKEQADKELKYGFLYQSIEQVSTLLQRGISPRDISSLFNIISKQRQPFLLQELESDISRYASLRISVFMKEQEYKNIMNNENNNHSFTRVKP